ncbi:uncharacterized protein SAPINGB_P002196 [Magnusiomyces paraingens]|uniref:GRAM domain-containing protein n=1 Tax=Magnusiomyces paraingens TaxID=2606893 RepID=A0A5E8BKL5_9ASCO|nr:uncharacterized protein SAPINGB_P002196 [Saprochaete ingens]VVT49286.1 unnamed protein product [Saprochaete ingens]
MSVNWVTLDNQQRPVPLPGEEFVFEQNDSDARLSLSCKTIDKTPGATIDSSAGGRLFLSTQRLIYLAESTDSRYHIEGKGDALFDNLAVPLSGFKGARLHQPWIGPNAWVGVFVPTNGGGLNPELAMWEMKISFATGGALDFARLFQRALEARTLQQSHIDELPQYTPI